MFKNTGIQILFGVTVVSLQKKNAKKKRYYRLYPMMNVHKLFSYGRHPLTRRGTMAQYPSVNNCSGGSALKEVIKHGKWTATSYHQDSH